MKKVLSILCLCLLFLTGCTVENPPKNDVVNVKGNLTGNRFVTTGETYYVDGLEYWKFIVIKDTKTKILYLYDYMGHQGGLTPLLDENGQVVKDK